MIRLLSKVLESGVELKGQVVIYLSPKGFQRMALYLEDLKQRLGDGVQLTLTVKEELKEGELLIETQKLWIERRYKEIMADHVVIYPQRNKPIEGEIIGFNEDRCIIMPFSLAYGVDDISLDPVADSLMGVLDGHIILSRKRANAGIYPAIDPVRSLSRLMPHVVSKEHMQVAMYIREVLSAYESLEDMVHLGIYTQGSNPLVDKVVKNQDRIREFFRQGVEQRVSYEESLQALKALYEKLL